MTHSVKPPPLMRRSILITTLLLGATLTAISGTGIFSALNDTTRTATNDVKSAPLAGSSDLQMSSASVNGSGGIDCATYSENLSSALFTFTAGDVVPNYSLGQALVCIRNVGSQTVSLSWYMDELTDVDYACTGDEAISGDTTCGGSQVGELSKVIQTQLYLTDCTNANSATNVSSGVLSTLASPVSLNTTILSNQAKCFRVNGNYLGNNAAADVQKAQSDEVTWRYAFVGQA